jgi:uncharacterized protein YuzE
VTVIGNLDFDRVRYDAKGDVLYLHRADPKEAVDFDASPEGHHLRFNAAGELIGVTLVNAKWLSDTRAWSCSPCRSGSRSDPKP